MITKYNPEFLAPLAQLVIHLGYIVIFESLGQKNAAGWRLGMEFIADPSVLYVVNPLELVDNALADVAEGSDVIGEDFYVDHVPSLAVIFLNQQLPFILFPP